MAFLDNSGDIILDAVLTDAGRKRLARGDGSFKVTKFAFGDDEIDYGNYNPNATGGSSNFDLEILQTPLLEAFTNNRSSLKSKLISLTNNNLLFLPELVLNEVQESLTKRPESTNIVNGAFVVAVNQSTQADLIGDFAAYRDKLVHGYGTPSIRNGSHIRVDQGLNTTKLDALTRLSSELIEQQYILTIDNRFGMISDVYAGTQGSLSFIDDDQIATYYLTKRIGQYVIDCAVGQLSDQTGETGTYVGAGTEEAETITGPRGTKLRFGVMASDNLRASNYLFDTIGRTVTEGSNTYLVIDTKIKVMGVTTGYHIDVPVTFVKTQET
tara:strand:- start:2360 stop:3337 length:978 start_codon:yes stop_codon:yes gene_type:complete